MLPRVRPSYRFWGDTTSLLQLDKGSWVPGEDGGRLRWHGRGSMTVTPKGGATRYRDTGVRSGRGGRQARGAAERAPQSVSPARVTSSTWAGARVRFSEHPASQWAVTGPGSRATGQTPFESRSISANSPVECQAYFFSLKRLKTSFAADTGFMPSDSLALAPVFCCIVSLHLFHDKQDFILCPSRSKTLTCLRGWLFFFFA